MENWKNATNSAHCEHFAMQRKDKKKTKRTKASRSSFQLQRYFSGRVYMCMYISRNFASLTLHKYRSLFPSIQPLHTVQNSSKWSAIKHSSQLTLPHPIFLVSLILFDSLLHLLHIQHSIRFSVFRVFFYFFQPLERVPPRWGVKVLWNFNNDKL